MLLLYITLIVHIVVSIFFSIIPYITPILPPIQSLPHVQLKDSCQQMHKRLVHGLLLKTTCML